MFRVSWIELGREREELFASEAEAVQKKAKLVRELGLQHHMRGVVAIHEVQGD